MIHAINATNTLSANVDAATADVDTGEMEKPADVGWHFSLFFWTTTKRMNTSCLYNNALEFVKLKMVVELNQYLLKSKIRVLTALPFIVLKNEDSWSRASWRSVYRHFNPSNNRKRNHSITLRRRHIRLKFQEGLCFDHFLTQTELQNTVWGSLWLPILNLQYVFDYSILHFRSWNFYTKMIFAIFSGRDSCEGRCNRYFRGFPCDCTSRCKRKHNCCDDYKKQCKKQCCIILRNRHETKSQA